MNDNSLIDESISVDHSPDYDSPLDESKEDFPESESSNFSAKERLFDKLTNLKSPAESVPFLMSSLGEEKTEILGDYNYETVHFFKWKNYENISARMIETYDDVVLLECLVDKENEIYEEREFRLTLFEGYDLKPGNLFLLRFFERKNESRIEVHDNPALVNETDFPKRDFQQIFMSSKLFKKRI